MIMAGASAVQVVSGVYKHGYDVVKHMVHGMDKWLDQNGIASLSELIGCAGSSKVKNPAMYERVQFMKYFGEFDQPVD